MEKQKQRQKKKREKQRRSILEHQIPDAPTLEEFECLLGESPTNYPKGEGVENMESELHSAAIDIDVYEKEIAERAAHENEYSLQVETTNKILPSHENTQDEVDTVLPFSAEDNALNNQIEQMQANITAIKLVDIPSTATDEPNQAMQMSEDSSAVTSCQKQTELLDSKKDTRNVLKEIRPFTEQQLVSLYNNQELALVDTFVNKFTETQLRSGPLRQQHRLHELLMGYLRVRNHLIANSYCGML